MTNEEAARIMAIEKECVLRQDTDKCNRDSCGCHCCDLIQETKDVLEAYDKAIIALKTGSVHIGNVDTLNIM